MGPTPAPGARRRNREHVLMVPAEEQGATMPGNGRNSRIDVARIAAVALLLLIAAVGLRSRAGFSTSPPSWAESSFRAFITLTGAVVGLAAVGGVVLLVLMFSGRRRKRPEHEPVHEPEPRSRLARALALLFALAVVSLPAVLLATHPYARRAVTRPRESPSAGSEPNSSATHRPVHTAPVHMSALLAIGVGIAAVAALVILALALRADRHRPSQRPQESAANAPPQAPLREALAGATRALDDTAGPRHAIIASYAAMEAHLAGAGAAPAAADTPDEVLTRAAAAGLVRSPAAGTLTALFRRARYSRHRVGEADREAAAAALARLCSDLDDAP